MTTAQPTIGVYITTHNRVELLQRAIQSVLEQSYQNFKILIIDDGSQDGTWDYLQTLDDPRIRCIRNEQAQGSCRSRNIAIAELDTPLVTGLDDDDRFLPHRLATLLEYYSDEYAFSCSGYYWDYGARQKALFNKDKVISLSDALDLNECSNQILVKRERVLAVGGFDPKLPALQDHDLWVRLIAKFGSAYRVGSPSYVVNDDRSFERISSRSNKETAIELFREKHQQRMSERNKANFRFYEQKIKREKISLKELFQMRRHGLGGLKLRHYLAQRFSPLSRLRLTLLARQKPNESVVSTFFKRILPPLIATGGPGASRVILLSASIYFFNADLTADFGADFFVLMLLNTAFAQSFGFYLLKPEYAGSSRAIYWQSLSGLGIAAGIVVLMWFFELISMLSYALAILVVLHFYYVLRFRFIAAHRFRSMAVAELLISLICLLAPWYLSATMTSSSATIYQVYLAAIVLGAILLTWQTRTLSQQGRTSATPSFKEVRNIAVSNTGGIFAVFVLPTAIKQIAEPNIVSVVALAISCVSISILIPRTYANTILTSLAQPQLKQNLLEQIQRRYKGFVSLSVLFAYAFTLAYLALMGFSVSAIWWLPLAVCILILFAQNGFVILTYLSLQKQDGYVAKLNLAVLIANATFIAIALYGFRSTTALYLALGLAALMFIGRNYLAQRYSESIALAHNTG